MCVSKSIGMKCSMFLDDDVLLKYVMSCLPAFMRTPKQLISSDLMGPNISFSVTHLYIYCSFSFVPIISPLAPQPPVFMLKN